MMIQSARNRDCGNGANPLDRSPHWRILLEGSMRTRLIVISRIGGKYAAQVPFPKNSNVVQALAAKRADQALGYPILPG
jgi:hypothetical protein